MDLALQIARDKHSYLGSKTTLNRIRKKLEISRINSKSQILCQVCTNFKEILKILQVNIDDVCLLFEKNLAPNGLPTCYDHKELTRDIHKNSGQYEEQLLNLQKDLQNLMTVQFPCQISHLQASVLGNRKTAVVTKEKFDDSASLCEWIIISMVGCTTSSHCGELHQHYGRHVSEHGVWIHERRKNSMRKMKILYNFHKASTRFPYVCIGDFATPYILKVTPDSSTCGALIKGCTTYFNAYSMVVRIYSTNEQEEVWFALSDHSVKGDYVLGCKIFIL